MPRALFKGPGDSLVDEILDWASSQVFNKFEILRLGKVFRSGEGSDALQEELYELSYSYKNRMFKLVLYMDNKEVASGTFIFSDVFEKAGKSEESEGLFGIQYWRDKCAILEEENQRLKIQVDELLEANEELAESPDWIDKVFQNLKDPRIGSIIGSLLSGRKGLQQSAAVSGVDYQQQGQSQWDQVCNELVNYDDQLLFHLQQLLKIAKSNPVLWASIMKNFEMLNNA
ncbi:MAG: hypothetical protein IRZ03_19110 [Acidobacterium ailaaui]|nr:hypothetical protein [Pseudacidobacterium ailaaui]